MTLTVKSFITALALASLPLSAVAQETATDAEPTTDAEATTDAEVEGNTVPGTDLSLGQPADGGLGQTYVKESHGDWDVRCIRTENGNDPCQLYQLLVDGNNNAVAEINLFVVSGNDQIAGGATIVTPLETLLTTNLRLAIDGGQARVYPFSFCRTIGCFARLGLTEAEIGQFRAGNAAKVIIVPAAAPDQTVELTASLTGFTAGWKALVELSQPPAQE